MASDVQQQDVQTEYATYLSLIGLFTALFAAFTTYQRQQRNQTNLSPFDLALLGIATYRAGRLVAYDKVTEPLRSPFAETKQNESGNETVEARGTGARKAIGELVSCPTCIGTWIAAFFVYGLGIAPQLTRTVLAVVGVGGVAEIIDSSVEALNQASEAAKRQGSS